jgi:predicted ATP-grasp superfamily ATP-dependent carboligase
MTRIFIVEYVAGGGLAGQPLPPSLLAEGAAMLHAAVADFAALGAGDVITLRDARLDVALPATTVHLVRPGLFDDAVDAALRACDTALVIAPETGGVLASLTARVEAAGVLNLGSSSAGVRIAGDKLTTIARLARAGVTVPPTRAVATAGDVAALGFPVVLKPRDGAGAIGLRLVRRPAELEAGWAQASAEATGAGLLAQPYVAGQHASVSLLCTGAGAHVLSLNSQEIAESERFEYRGGVVPLEHRDQARALAAATAAAQAIPGLRGYVGVDLVLADEPTVMEVNPRLTTAYTGLRHAVDVNLAGLLVDAARGRPIVLPPLVRRVSFDAAGRVEARALSSVA